MLLFTNDCHNKNIFLELEPLYNIPYRFILFSLTIKIP